MSLNLYDLSVPVLVRALEQQLNILKTGEKWAEDNNVDKQKLLDGKLADDMKPLPFQIVSFCNSAKLMVSRIGGVENVPADDSEKTFDEFYARINKTIEILKSAKRENFVGPEDRVKFKLGPGEADFKAINYVQKFVMPNFFFHHTTSYLILRNQGVPVGKLLYLGASDITHD